MKVIDYSASFVTFVTFGQANNARIQVESRCRAVAADGTSEELLLVASCKAEDTYAADHLFRQPNYDFCCIFGDGRYRILRTPLRHDPSVSETGVTTERFEQVHCRLREAPDAELCADASAVVEATLRGDPLVARTELHDETTGTSYVLEYPIKTMNVGRDPDRYQVDTGPLALPPHRGWDGSLDRLDLAFVAFNVADWAEFIVRRPTPVEPSGTVVDFYQAIEVRQASNSIYALRG